MIDFTFGDLVGALNKAQELKTTSLPQFTKPATIQSPMFIQDSLMEESITNDVINNLYNIYIGYVLTALNLASRVEGDRTIRDLISTVGTETDAIGALESFGDADSLAEDFYNFGTEMGPKSRQRQRRASRKSKRAGLPNNTPNGTGKSNKYRNKGSGDSDDPSKKRSGSIRVGTSSAPINLDKLNKLPIASGRILEVEFNLGDGKVAKAPVMIKFNPRIIPPEVVQYVVEANFKQSLHQRWLQMRSGEIRFIKDFIMNLDILDKREKALKKDKNNALGDIFRQQNKAGLRLILKAIFHKSPTYNIANSVLILNENDVARHSKKIGFNLLNIKDRTRFFAKTFTLFIVLIDPNYSQVSIFTNGISDVATYTFNEIKANASRDNFDLVEIMQALEKNQMPKY